MPNATYKKLREQLDQYSVGFPETESGIEIKILEKLFTQEEARMYLDLSMILEPPESVAKRVGSNAEKTAEMLESMAKKGLIFRKRTKDTVLYAVVPFVIGSYEFQLKSMDKEFAQMVEAYFNEALLDSMLELIPPLRTIPVNQTVDIASNIAPYSDAKLIIQSKEKIALADCICRKQKGLLNEGCEKPKEVCLIFGSHADYYLENGLARPIDQKEALTILDECEKAGLVNQPTSTVNPGGMCNCCGDCCGILRALNKMPNPSDMVMNNYWAAVDQDLCSGCETCIDRCQMEAVSMNDDQISEINTDRCIGCGLCVTTCSTEALSLILKPEEKRNEPLETPKDLMLKTAEKRGTSLKPLFMKES